MQDGPESYNTEQLSIARCPDSVMESPWLERVRRFLCYDEARSSNETASTFKLPFLSSPEAGVI